jgi:hypothetical protein
VEALSHLDDAIRTTEALAEFIAATDEGMAQRWAVVRDTRNDIGNDVPTVLRGADGAGTQTMIDERERA